MRREVSVKTKKPKLALRIVVRPGPSEKSLRNFGSPPGPPRPLTSLRGDSYKNGGAEHKCDAPLSHGAAFNAKSRRQIGSLK